MHRRTRARALRVLVSLLAVTALGATDCATAGAANGPAGTITIGSGLCLTGGTSGATAAIQSCGGSDQSWQYDPVTSALSENGACLAVAGGSDVPGTLTQQGACDGSAPQQWVILTNGQIMSSKSGTCLAATGGTLTAGTTVSIATCSAAQTAQKWSTSIGVPVGYTLSGTAATKFNYPYDTPAMSFLDKDGTFYFQESLSQYGSAGPRNWLFYTGANFDSVSSAPQSTAVNPANSQDSNADTTWRCNSSPTGVNATYAPTGSSYSQKNFCDLLGVWVDPDTGAWYGMVHNEFTPQPFGDGWHYDAIDYAVSTDQGNTWTITGHAITSPYSTTRGDTTAFPNQTYYYGDGDPRLFVDTASGYFYLYYFSRVVTQGAGSQVPVEHVARAPISGKMATGTWQKWYNGAWTQPGVGGAESELLPTTASGTGYIAPADDYTPSATGNTATLVSNGKLRATGMNGLFPAWNAYLGAYIARVGNEFYEARDLATQQWVDLGTSSGYSDTSGYYQFLVDADKTSESVLGNTFRVYCNAGCPTYGAEYSTITLNRTTAPAPSSPVVSGSSYQIASGDGSVLVQSGTSSAPALDTATASNAGAAGDWTFTDNGDGFYTVTNTVSGLALGVGSTSNAGRAWESAPTLSAPASGSLGQEWAIQQAVSSPANSGASTGTGQYRLINRYSGLVLSDSSALSPTVATSPARSWTASSPAAGADGRTPGAQLLTFTAATPPVVSGGAYTVNLTQGGVVMDDPGSSTTPGKQLIVYAPNGGGANQKWTFTANSDATYTLKNASSGLCVDDKGNGTTAGTWVIQYTCNGGDNQEWSVAGTGSGYELINKHSGLLITASGTANGSVLTQQPATSGAPQSWTFTRVG